MRTTPPDTCPVQQTRPTQPIESSRIALLLDGAPSTPSLHCLLSHSGSRRRGLAGSRGKRTRRSLRGKIAPRRRERKGRVCWRQTPLAESTGEERGPPMRRSVLFSGWALPTDTITGLCASAHDMREWRDVEISSWAKKAPWPVRAARKERKEIYQRHSPEQIGFRSLRHGKQLIDENGHLELSMGPLGDGQQTRGFGDTRWEKC
ncbi:hypothetical protein QBC41DRAFT_124443 [Cercophora samala]|uniref:Uncharacterized protein n=1 Tax=Cercophora samala TaxID=330535 RepID=A0AA40DBV1_9PEZI|nr:hypothetical protein QBC41DRAFT_124443 [Cercophora samala]